MKQLALALVFLLPASASAASISPSTFLSGQSVLLASSSPSNLYASGGSIAITWPINGDLSLLGGSILSAAQVMGDALLLGGFIVVDAPINGDARLGGGTVSVRAPIHGDLVALGGSVSDTSTVEGSTFVVGTEVTMTGGAKGPVTIYGNNVLLGGNFEGDVDVVAGGRVSLAEGTQIGGVLNYESPEQAKIPTSATVAGGVHYTGASYLPTSGQSQALLFASFGVFLLVRFLASIILAGLVAGLFPQLSEMVSRRAFEKRTRSIVLTTLLGFAVLVATPVLLALLSLTFVGLGIAILIASAFLLLSVLAFVFAGILVGSFLARKIMKRTTVLWHDGAVGMLVLSFFGLIPYLGFLVFALLFAFAEGALVALFFGHYFVHTTEEVTLL